MLLIAGQVLAQSFRDSFAGAEGTANNGQNAVMAFKEAVAQTDRLYAHGDYDNAFPRYLTMAKYGDKFSQYRLAVMYELGRGVDKDLIQAFAWSYVAAETGHKQFKDYHKAVRAQLIPEQINSAKQITRDYQIDYGMYAAADNANSVVNKTLKSCTGSRVGARCDRVSSQSVSCSLNNFGIPDKNCLQLGMLGIPGVMGMQPVDLRTARGNLSRLKDEYNPGRIEYRELRLINE
ncbi:MAG: hypothetical protein PF630_11600 [Gammaproteobacteria bacterium]|nr:hypothetical protein [Gammaproteobacteria bacterium]